MIGRIVAQHLSLSVEQQVLVDNRAGANGSIGTGVASNSNTDKCTLLMSFDGTLAINPHTYKNLLFDPQRDLTPIVNVGQAALITGVHPSVKAAEFVALAKASSNAIFYSSAGNGNARHVAGELFATHVGIHLTHVPYKGWRPFRRQDNRLAAMFGRISAPIPWGSPRNGSIELSRDRVDSKAANANGDA